MVFVACGLNYKTAPIDLREKIAAIGQDSLLAKLTNIRAVKEAAVLSTCNRTEFYCDTDCPDELAGFLASEYQFKQSSAYLYNYQNQQGIRHALRVASGLDSMVLGEVQIFGQMKQAYINACRSGTIKTNLHHIFQYIFNATKRIRKESGIDRNSRSIAYSAVQLICQKFNNLPALKVFLIGSGETTTLVAKYLHKQGVRHFTIASRSTEHARQLADLLIGEVVEISKIVECLPHADIIISATSCPIPFINREMVQVALKLRQHAPMFFLDLAIPRDIVADVCLLPAVHLYNIDNLQAISQKGLAERQLAAKVAEQLVDYEVAKYISKARIVNVNGKISNYRQLMESLAHAELRRARTQLVTGNYPDVVLQEFAQRLLNKLLHAPTVKLRQAAQDNNTKLLDLIDYLFDDGTALDDGVTESIYKAEICNEKIS